MSLTNCCHYTRKQVRNTPPGSTRSTIITYRIIDDEFPEMPMVSIFPPSIFGFDIGEFFCDNLEPVLSDNYPMMRRFPVSVHPRRIPGRSFRRGGGMVPTEMIGSGRLSTMNSETAGYSFPIHHHSDPALRPDQNGHNTPKHDAIPKHQNIRRLYEVSTIVRQ